LEIELIALAFIVLGAAAQTVLQYCAKILQAPEGTLKFDAKYIATLIIAIILTISGALALFMVWPIPVGLPVAYVIAAAFLAGFAVNVGTNVTLNTYQGVQQKNKEVV
jgi:fatty acid desaturase